MSLSVSAWHRRYQQQAGWTFTIRQSLFARAGLENARRVLDVGCGTGVLSAEVAGKAQAVYGLDLALEPLQFARHAAPGPAYTRGDAHWLPYRNDCFDIVFCHFLLFWVADPVRAAAEMKRVTRPGGSVLLLAEPDYGGRIDYPSELARLGSLQAEALARQGASINTGRRLGEILGRAGLQPLETGLLGGQWTSPPSPEDWENEWTVLRADLQGMVTSAELDRLQEIDRQAWQAGSRVLFVPTFYAWGRKPAN